MKLCTDSVSRFICAARNIADGNAFTISTLDFDNLRFFTNRYGPITTSQAVQESRTHITAALDALMPEDYAVLFSSGDEAVIAHGCSVPQQVAQAISLACKAASSACRLLFAPNERPFSFTAATCSSIQFTSCHSTDDMICLMVAASEKAVEALKAVDQRSVSAVLTAQQAQKSDDEFHRIPLVNVIWQQASAVAQTAQSLAPYLLGYRELWDAVQSHQSDSTLALIRPLYGGALWHASRSTLDGGIERLPDGTEAGKQGFLNRLVGHLTSSLINELVSVEVLETTQAISTTAVHTPPAQTARLSSCLYYWWPAALPSTELAAQLVAALEQTRSNLNSVLPADLKVDRFQLGIFVGSSRLMNCVHSLAHRVFAAKPSSLIPGASLTYLFGDSNIIAFENTIAKRHGWAMRLASQYAATHETGA